MRVASAVFADDEAIAFFQPPVRRLQRGTAGKIVRLPGAVPVRVAVRLLPVITDDAASSLAPDLDLVTLLLPVVRRLAAPVQKTQLCPDPPLAVVIEAICLRVRVVDIHGLTLINSTRRHHSRPRRPPSQHRAGRDPPPKTGPSGLDEQPRQPGLGPNIPPFDHTPVDATTPFSGSRDWVMSPSKPTEPARPVESFRLVAAMVTCTRETTRTRMRYNPGTR